MLEIKNLPVGKAFSVSEGVILALDGIPKLKLRENDTFGRVIFQGKEMLYADKKLTVEESEARCGLVDITYNCFI